MATKKKPVGCGGMFIAAVFALIIYKNVVPSEPKTPTPEPPKTAEQEQADKMAADAQLGAIMIKSAMKDPASLKFTEVLLMSDGTACYTYIAKNSFGAMAEERAVYSKKTGLKIGQPSSASYQSHCAGRSGKRLTTAANLAI